MLFVLHSYKRVAHISHTLSHTNPNHLYLTSFYNIQFVSQQKHFYVLLAVTGRPWKQQARILTAAWMVSTVKTIILEHTGAEQWFLHSSMHGWFYSKYQKSERVPPECNSTSRRNPSVVLYLNAEWVLCWIASGLITWSRVTIAWQQIIHVSLL